jgi:hypothetical protein
MSDPLVFPAAEEVTATTIPESDTGRGVLPKPKDSPDSAEQELLAKSRRELQDNFDKYLPNGDDTPPEAPSEQMKEPVTEPARAEIKEPKPTKKTRREPEPESAPNRPDKRARIGPGVWGAARDS